MEFIVSKLLSITAKTITANTITANTLDCKQRHFTNL